MSAIFWVVTIIMTVLAFGFLANPLIRSAHQRLTISLGIALPAIAAGTYLAVGSPGVASSHAVAALASPAARTSQQGGDKVASVSSMIEGLEARLEANPEDSKGWLLLARSYRHLNRTEDAAEAYANAAALGEQDPEMESLPAASDAKISGKLSLSATAAAIVQADDTVFIFARPVGGAGAPAAVLQRPASELPINFLLNDRQSMVPGVRLSDFDVVEVTARISRSGVATDALQGLEAKSGPVKIADQAHLSLVIE